MNNPLLLIMCFSAGVFFQAFLLSGRRIFLLGMLIGGLAVAAFFKPFDSDAGLKLFVVFLSFAFLFAFSFREEILPVITDKLLLSFHTVFLYIFFSFYYQDNVINRAVTVGLMLATLIVLYIAFAHPKLSYWSKLFLYSWSLALVVCIGVSQFSFSYALIFFDPQGWTSMSLLDSFVTGMAFLYLAIHCYYLWALLPIPYKGQLWEDRLKEWQEFSALMVKRYDDRPHSHLESILIIVLQGGALLLNYRFHLLSPGMAVCLSVILPVGLAACNAPGSLRFVPMKNPAGRR